MLGVAAAAAEAVRSHLAVPPLVSGMRAAPNASAYDFLGHQQHAQSSGLFGALSYKLRMFASTSELEGNNTSQVAVFVALAAIACTLYFYQAVFAAPAGLKPPKGSQLHVLRGWIPSMGQTSFYSPTRTKWVMTHMGDICTPQDEHPLRMNVSKYVVSIVHGMTAAKDFFGSRHNNFYAGYAALFSGVEVPHSPPLNDSTDVENERKIDIWAEPPANSEQHTVWRIKHLRNCLTNKRLTEHNVMPKVANDCWRGLEKIWREDGITDAMNPPVGKTGIINMHKQLYEIMFRISVRIVGPTEIAETEDLSPAMDAYWVMENNQSYVNTLMSNMPTRSNRLRKVAGRELQQYLMKPIEDRLETRQKQEDYIQSLLDSGRSPLEATIWLTTMLFASIINSSSIFAWTMALASADPAIWKKMQSEVDETLDRLCVENDISKDAPVLEKIGAISIEQLEENFGYTYWCIRETIRMLLVDFSYRRVDSKSDTVTIGGQQVRRGEYAAFCMGTVHRDGRVYSSPERYDPDRWVRGEGSKPYEFLGWGAGVHPCIGMKLAKNELKLSLAMFVACMDMKPVDLAGNVYAPETIPLPDLFRGGYRLPSKPLRLQYTVRHA